VFEIPIEQYCHFAVGEREEKNELVQVITVHISSFVISCRTLSMLVWCMFLCWRANHAGGGCSAKPAKRRTSGSQIHRQALADQQLHPHHTSIHHELPPYRQGRRPREASRHRPPHPAQRLRRGRLRQDQAVPSSSSPGTHRPWLAHMPQFGRPDGAQQK
jgi:hypothetical protein